VPRKTTIIGKVRIDFEGFALGSARAIACLFRRLAEIIFCC
jgi:hypothetical protein